MSDGDGLLRPVEAERGYLLPYHRMFAAHAPALLEAYGAYYRELTLRPRALSEAEKETVWAALLAAAREAHGTIHLRRAEAAGLPRARLADAVAIAAAVEAWPVVAFAQGDWGAWTPGAAMLPRYLRMVEAARGETPAWLAEMSAAVCHAARRTWDGMAVHLPRAFGAGAGAGQMCEALSFLLLPCGGPTLIEAVEVWAQAHEGEPGVVPSPYGVGVRSAVAGG